MSVNTLQSGAPSLQLLTAGRDTPTVARNYGQFQPGTSQDYAAEDRSLLVIARSPITDIQHADVILSVGESVTLDADDDYWFLAVAYPVDPINIPSTGVVYYGLMDGNNASIASGDNLSLPTMVKGLGQLLNAYYSKVVPGALYKPSFTANNATNNIPTATYALAQFTKTYDGNSGGSIALRPNGKGIFLPGTGGASYKISGGFSFNTQSQTGKRIAQIGWITGNADLLTSGTDYLQAKFCSLSTANGAVQSGVFDTQRITVPTGGITIGILGYQDSGAGVTFSIDTYLNVKEI